MIDILLGYCTTGQEIVKRIDALKIKLPEDPADEGNRIKSSEQAAVHGIFQNRKRMRADPVSAEPFHIIQDILLHEVDLLGNAGDAEHGIVAFDFIGGVKIVIDISVLVQFLV